MFGVLANYHYDTLSFDDLALIADLFNGWFYFHLITIPFLFCTPGDAALGEVVYRNLNRYLVTGQYPDIVHSELTRNVRGHYMTVGQLYLEGGIGQCLNYRPFKFHYIVLSQNYPSKPAMISKNILSANLCQKQRTVIRDRNRMLVVGKVRTPYPPAFTIGSIAIVIPEQSRTPFPAVP